MQKRPALNYRRKAKGGRVDTKDGRRLYPLLFVLLLALIPVSAVSIPRFIAYGPGITGVLFFALYMRYTGHKLQFSKPVFAIVAGAVFLALASCLWAIDPGDALHRTGRMALVLLGGAFLVSLVQAFDLDRLKPHLWMIPASVMAAAALIVVELKWGAPLHNLARGLPVGAHVKTAEFNRAAVTVALCLFPAAVILRRRVSKKVFAILVSALVLPALLITESQSSQLAVMLGLIFMLAFPYKSKVAWHVLAGAIFILVLAAPMLSIWSFNHFAAGLQAMPVIGRGGGFAGNRLEIWDYVSRYALQKPLLGYGIEAAREITDFDSHQIFQKGTSILHPHNFALQLWLEFGVIGALCGAALISYLLHAMRVSLSVAQGRIALPTLIAALSVASTGYGMWQGWWLGLLFLSASFCILAIRLEPDASKTVA